MQDTATNAVMGLSPETATGLSMFLFVLAAFMFLLTVMAVMKRRSQGQTGLPGAGVMLLLIGLGSLVLALMLKFGAA